MTSIPALAAAILSLAPHVPRHEVIQDASYFVGYGVSRGIEPELLAAVAMRELTFNRLAVSSFRAKDGSVGHSVGLLGIKTTAEPRDLFDVSANVNAGAKLLAAAIKACGGDVANGLSAYSLGRGVRSKNCKPTKYSGEVMAIYFRLIELTTKGGG